MNVSAQCSKYFNAILRGSITAAAQKPPNSASCHQHTSPSLPRSAQRGAQLTIFVMGSHQTVDRDNVPDLVSLQSIQIPKGVERDVRVFIPDRESV